MYGVRSAGCGVWSADLELYACFTLALRLYACSTLYACTECGVRGEECGVQIWNYTLALRLLYAYTLALIGTQ